MVSTRGRAPKPPAANGVALADATPPLPLAAGTEVASNGGGGTHEYERCRDERIRKNMERMQKLGILDLASNLRANMVGRSPASKRPYKRRATSSSSPLAPGLPPRRSSRLQNVTPVSYVEFPVKRKDEEKNIEISLREGSKEEIYTDEHEKLLGTYETSWTLFVDGYNKDGVRVYDPVNGKTCHQCRQKTLGHRTHCSKCNIVQGQFCGDCLYMRYGENVLEANKNPDWTCPVCRSICNCSICRTKKGWAPTGSLYKQVSRLGFKSVAHYLILTRRGGENIGGEALVNPISAKRSLPFTDEEGPSENSDSNNNDDHCNGQVLLLDFDNNENRDAKCSRDEDMQNLNECNSVPTLGSSEISRIKLKKLESGLLCSEEDKDAKCGGDEEIWNGDECDGSPALKDAGMLRQKEKKVQSALILKPSPDSIAGRLRAQGTGSPCSQFNGEKKTGNGDECIGSIAHESSEKPVRKGEEHDLIVLPSYECIPGRLGSRTIKTQNEIAS